MADIFSKIAAGDIPSYKCAENDQFYAFLDINPVAKGHTLVIPRKEIDYIFDMSDDDLAAFEVFAKKVAKAIRTAIPQEGGPSGARSGGATRSHTPHTHEQRG